MSSRVKKSKSKSKVKLAEHSDLLSAILQSAIKMKTSCSFCKARGLACKASPSVSSAYAEYVYQYEPYYNAQGVTVQQL
jgi:hypothetical protein